MISIDSFKLNTENAVDSASAKTGFSDTMVTDEK